ncbi:hypothetical protein [Solimicrobium silvestre]|uniref:DUF2116 family Zn-ribbon domain-containing protein n=1 Tax=Solimicrobium silvestre TaxID=2099400 RepID=A0A2S9GT31_9BURK|nr:hypothetical protein [Solimicrobium silvestre]PRC90861.1 hypothetical protein S2091_4442 [Solimicrobium silvestre]
MSDIADRSDKIIHAEIAAGLARVHAAPVLAFTGCCRYCEEAVAEPSRFCNVECRDDFEREMVGLRRAGNCRF